MPRSRFIRLILTFVFTIVVGTVGYVLIEQWSWTDALYMTAITLFLLLNGHHILLNALKESFDILPIGSIGLDSELFQRLMNTFGNMFVVAVKIGAPAIAVLLFTKVVFGLITKLIPQMNIMIVAFPVQIMMGLLFFGISLNTLLLFMERYLEGLFALLLRTLTLLKV